MTPSQKSFLDLAEACAVKSRHIWPQMAACEAALESSYGLSLLALQDNNLFGMKQHRHVIYGTHKLPTKEVEGGEWVTTSASFIHYPSWEACFYDRMSTLLRLSSVYSHYAAALDAKTPEEYVINVSLTWSTDPLRAQRVLKIFRECLNVNT